MERLLSVEEVAELLAMNPQTVREMARRGELVGLKSGRGGKTSPWRFRPAAVEAFVGAREQRARAGH